MRMSAGRIRAINHAIARVNGIICGASDRPVRQSGDKTGLHQPDPMAGVVKVMAIPRPANP